MKILNIVDNVFHCVDAVGYADRNRKLVRQIETGKRRIASLSEKTLNRYKQTVDNSGNYSKNPIKRFVAFIKNWNVVRKDKKLNTIVWL